MAQSRFRRPAGGDVTAAAQRRLGMLRQELAQAGVHPLEHDPPILGGPDGAEEDTAAVGPVVVPTRVPEPGRHARRRRAGIGDRLRGWLVDRLPPTLQGRARMGSAQAALVAVLAALGLAAAAVVALRSGSGGEAVVPVSGSVPGSTGPVSASPLVAAASAGPAGAGWPSADGAATGSTPGSASGSPSPGVLVVDVAGKVRHPGVTTLPVGSRVVDAIRKAGGARRGVDLAGLNLARVLVDGEQILVGVTPPPGVAASAASAATAAATPGQLVNLNTATLEGLEALPGVGPVTAQKILDWRTAHGAFSSVDELLEVDGIGEKTLADLAPYATL